jgi:hypothetical protein
MSEPSKEARLLLAVKAYREHPKLGYRAIARSYRVAESILRSRVKGLLPIDERRLVIVRLIVLEEKVILERILNLAIRGFAPRIASIKDIANFILASQERGRVSTR